MNAAGVDLVLRVVQERLRDQPCSWCESPLRAGHAVVRAVRDDEIVIEVACPACATPNVLQVRPDSVR